MKIGLKTEAKRIKGFFKKLPRTIGEHFFLSFLFFVLLAIIFGGIVFYRYIFLAENTEINILERPVFFNIDVYNKVLEELQNREKIIQELDSVQYSNPFSAPVSPSNETSPG